mmetsp:Transcript_6309/g.6857  ORF Transcript_6309/g.6857 Transcript_6309/m.6857 type:complete len:145 (-) Transcript_6309:32-466(-)
MSSLQEAVNESRLYKRARDKEEDEPLQYMVKRLRVHDSAESEEQQRQQTQYRTIHQQQSVKYITHIHYHSNLCGENTSSLLDHLGEASRNFQQSAGEDTCSGVCGIEEIPLHKVSPMNRFLGSLHQQRRLEKQQERGKYYILPK